MSPLPYFTNLTLDLSEGLRVLWLLQVLLHNWNEAAKRGLFQFWNAYLWEHLGFLPLWGPIVGCLGSFPRLVDAHMRVSLPLIMESHWHVGEILVFFYSAGTLTSFIGLPHFWWNTLPFRPSWNREALWSESNVELQVATLNIWSCCVCSLTHLVLVGHNCSGLLICPCCPHTWL